MTNEPVDTAASKEKNVPGIIAACHDTCFNLITASYSLPLQLQPCSSNLPSLCTKDSSSIKSTKYEGWRRGVKITDNFYHTRSTILEAIDVLP